MFLFMVFMCMLFLDSYYCVILTQILSVFYLFPF